MPDSSPARSSHWIDLTPLREYPAFARLWGGSAITSIGGTMTLVAVGLHIFELTGSTFAVAMVGVIALVPMIVFGLYGGMLADTFDRRRLALVAALLGWFSTLGLAVLAWTQSDTLWLFYLATTVNSVATTVIGSSRAAIVPRLLPPALLPSAGALNGISIGVSMVVGPMLAGVLVASVGYPWTYTIDLVLFFAGFFGIVTLPAIIPEGTDRQTPGLRSLVDGLRFVRSSPHIRGSFLVDIAAMTFGHTRALLPAIGAVVLGGSAVTVGVLTAASAVGALSSSLFSGKLRHVRYQGRAIANAIYGYAASIVLFGVVVAAVMLSGTARSSLSFDDVHWPGLIGVVIAMFLLGFTDNISAIFRGTLLQVATPDAMRGRMQGVFTVVVMGGPRVGDLYMGLTTMFLALWAPLVLGGLLIAATVFALTRGPRSLLGYDALNPTP